MERRSGKKENNDTKTKELRHRHTRERRRGREGEREEGRGEAPSTVKTTKNTRPRLSNRTEQRRASGNSQHDRGSKGKYGQEQQTGHKQ